MAVELQCPDIIQLLLSSENIDVNLKSVLTSLFFYSISYLQIQFNSKFLSFDQILFAFLSYFFQFF